MSISSNIKVTFVSNTDIYTALIRLIVAFESIQWTPENQRGKIVYLPLGDIDDYEWQEEFMNNDDMMNLFKTKLERGEHVGFELTKKPYFIGGDLLFYTNQSLTINLSINRRTTDEGFTDINWYLKEIYQAVNNAGFTIEGVFFNEHR